MKQQNMFVILVVCALLLTAFPGSALEVTLEPASSPAVPIGGTVFLEASVSDVEGDVWHRFRVRAPGGELHIVRDFGPEAQLEWTTLGKEGTYEIELTTRALSTGDTVTTSTFIDVVTRVTAGTAAVSATSHPLVFLYSAPPCVAGSNIYVEYKWADGAVQRTPAKACDPDSSSNFYLAGMFQNVEYTARHVVEGGGQRIVGEGVSYTTGSASGTLYPATVVQPYSASPANTILLMNGSGAPTATDLDGNILWYATGLEFITRAEQDGMFWTVLQGGRDRSRSIIRKLDLTGMTVLETNAERVNEQLRAMGKREITGFHHEAVTLPDGRIAALAGVEQILDNVQGPGPVDVLGDMIVVLDAELNVVWTWDAFDHLDVRRQAILAQTCSTTTAGCAPIYLAETANDWTHGNSVQPTPDGHLLFSTRHQDWLVKIDYANGNGDGHVIWRLGNQGDFQLFSNDPFPWFSHQHDANFDPTDPTSLLVFDNGNTRVERMGGGNSRGQALKLDEERRTATLTLNANLGVYASAVGSAQRLANGNYAFDAGYVFKANGISAYSIEVNPNGEIVYNATIANLSYRSFRMIDMYTPK